MAMRQEKGTNHADPEDKAVVRRCLVDVYA